jgi:hypothetical protein
MGKLNVKNGTPVGSKHLCKSCNWGQIMSGFRESDLLVICMNTSPNIVVPFTMHECSEFSDRRKPTWEEMEKLAIEVQPPLISGRTRGFHAVTKVQPVRVAEDEDNDENEAASVSAK